MPIHERHSPKHIAAYAVWTALLTLASVGNVRAQSIESNTHAPRIQTLRTAVDQRAGRVLKLFVCGDAATFDLEINPKEPILLRVDAGIKDYSYNPQEKTEYLLEGKRKLYILPDVNRTIGETQAARVWAKGFEFSAHLTVSDKLPSHSNIIIKHIAEGERLPAGRNPCKPATDRAPHRLRLRAASRHGKQTETVVGVPEIDHVSRSGDGPDINLSLAEWDEGHMVVDLAAVNPGFEPARLTRVEVTDKAGEKLQSEMWPWYDRNKPGAVDGASSLLIAGSDTARASVLVKDVNDHSMRSMVFKFHGIKGGAPFVTAVKVYRMVPVTEKDGKKDEKGDREGLITLGVQGIYGAVWLANPAEVGKLGATSTTGLAMRVRYGFSRRWSFEAELAGARSGSVEFSEVMHDDQQGDIRRDATLGRVLLGGVLHFGDRYRPMVRAGLGFQGVSHASRFMPSAGGEQDGPGSEFEVAGLWTVGLGFDARIGDHWTAGLGAQFVGTVTSLGDDGIKGSFEGGLHLSYQWTPQRKSAQTP